MRPLMILPLLLLASVAIAAPAIKAPATARLGSQLTFEVIGSNNPRDFVTVVRKGAPEGSYDEYVYVTPGKMVLQMPGIVGDYELRVCAAASPYGTLARQAIKIEGSPATVQAPATLKAGAQFEVAWTGPNNGRDYITIGNAATKYMD
jgi:Ca-activated chloride channel family protein